MPISIVVKTSQGNNVPSSLANGEIAYSYASNRLFIGTTPSAGDPVQVDYIGGKVLVDKVANVEAIFTGGSKSLNLASAVITGNATIDKLIFSTYTNNAILMAKSGGVVDFVTGTDGQVLQIAANGTPTFDVLNGGTY